MPHNDLPLSLRANSPFEVSHLRNLFTRSEDDPFLRPGASYPFVDSEWDEYFTLPDRHSILVLTRETKIGHFGLVREADFRFRFVFFDIAFQFRGRGVTSKVLEIAKEFAQSQFKAKELSLYVHPANSVASKLYLRRGFKEISRHPNQVYMQKSLHLQNT